MKRITRSRVTLPPQDLRLLRTLQARLGAKSTVEVVRRALRLLHESSVGSTPRTRQALREAYRRASLATRASLALEMRELD